MNVIINLIIRLYLTFRKEVYCEIREVFEKAKTFIDNEISIF